MIQRALLWAVGRYLGGPANSWVYTSALALTLRALKRVSGRRELIDTGKLKRGDIVVIEHLPVTHERQIKAFKAEQKAAKQLRRAAAGEARAARRARRRARRRQRLADLRRAAASIRTPAGPTSAAGWESATDRSVDAAADAGS